MGSKVAKGKKNVGAAGGPSDGSARPAEVADGAPPTAPRRASVDSDDDLREHIKNSTSKPEPAAAGGSGLSQHDITPVREQRKLNGMAPLSYAPPPDVDVAPDTVRHLAGKEEVDELDFLLDELRIVDEPTSKSRVVQPRARPLPQHLHRKYQPSQQPPQQHTLQPPQQGASKGLQLSEDDETLLADIEQHGIPPSTIGGGKQDRNDDLDLEEW